MRTRVSSQKDLGLCLRPTLSSSVTLGKVIHSSWPESPGQRLELSVCTDHRSGHSAARLAAQRSSGRSGSVRGSQDKRPRQDVTSVCLAPKPATTLLSAVLESGRHLTEGLVGGEG